jgi:hypothetical protein
MIDAATASSRMKIAEDSGEALANSASPTEASELAHKIWSSLEVTANELRIRANHSNPLIQLSALFGLAKFQATDISSLVDDAMSARPQWNSNPLLVTWLGKLKMGKASYPDRSMLNPPNALR